MKYLKSPHLTIFEGQGESSQGEKRVIMEQKTDIFAALHLKFDSV